jgi:hypothetical protein
MTVTETGLAPEAGPDAKTFQSCPPDGERFFAWAPDTVQLSPSDSLSATERWWLTGIDEDSFAF